MLPACSNAAGICTSTVPDVCKTPPFAIPIPYPNIGNLMQTTGNSTKVMFVGRPAVTIKSKMPMSMGDNAGVIGGVVSGMVMGEVKFTKGSSIVLVEGNACELVSGMTMHNKDNTMGLVAAPSQSVVKVAP